MTKSKKRAKSVKEVIAIVTSSGLLQEYSEIVQYTSQYEPLENFLMRFFKSCDFEPAFSISSLRKHLEWRRKNDIEGLCQSSAAEILGCEPEKVFLKFPFVESGKDKLGRNVQYYFAHKIDASGILKLTTIDRFIKYQVWLRELSIRKMQFKRSDDADSLVEPRPPYYTAVMDLKHCRLSQANSSFYALIKLLLELDDWHYPGRVAKLIVINAPFFFNIIWSIVRRFAYAAQKKVVVIYRDEHKVKKELLKHIPIENLPSNYGGGAQEISIHSANLDHEALRPGSGISVKENAYKEENTQQEIKSEGIAQTETSNTASAWNVNLEHTASNFYLVKLFETSNLDTDLRSKLISEIEKARKNQEASEKIASLERYGLRQDISHIRHQVNRLSQMYQDQAAQRQPERIAAFEEHIIELKLKYETVVDECNAHKQTVRFARKYIEEHSKEHQERVLELKSKKALLARENIILQNAKSNLF